MVDIDEQGFIPGTRTIRNLVRRSESLPFGTADPEELAAAELALSLDRTAELLENPVEGDFTFAHYREVHRRIFQDVYAWAGEPRRVPMSKLGTAYADPSEMNAMLRYEFARLREAGPNGLLRGIPRRDKFCRALADHWASINHAHAFREGNTRSQTVFFHQLAERAGWRIDVARLSPRHPESLRDAFVDARFHQQSMRQRDDVAPEDASLRLANVLYRMVSPIDSPEARLARGGIERESAAEPHRIMSRDPDLLRKELEQSGIAINPDGSLNLD